MIFVVIIYVKRMGKDTKKTLAVGKTRPCPSVLGLECVCVQCIGFHDTTFKIGVQRAVNFIATYTSLITMKRKPNEDQSFLATVKQECKEVFNFIASGKNVSRNR